MRNYFLLVSLLAAIVFCSCTNNTDEIVSVADTEISCQNQAMSDLQERIAELNRTYNVTTPMGDEVTRISILGSIFKWFVSVVYSDAVGAAFGAIIGSNWGTNGALVGAIVGGVSCSAAVACCQAYIPNPSFSSHFNRPQSSSALLANSFLQPIELRTTQDSIGYYHNLSILMMKEYNVLPVGIGIKPNPNNYVDSVKVFTDNIVAYEDTTTYNIIAPELKSYLSSYLNTVNDEKIVDFKKVSQMEFWDTHSDEFDLIHQYIVTMSTDNGADFSPYDYSQDYLELVEESDIKDSSKVLLKTAVTVGYASFNLWTSRIMF